MMRAVTVWLLLASACGGTSVDSAEAVAVPAGDAPGCHDPRVIRCHSGEAPAFVEDCGCGVRNYCFTANADEPSGPQFVCITR